ncbi:cupin-like domain-containing protein [Sphingopyxis sp. RIFCSPHIGHO2_12_FULL_65_19]|uniref:cupin-like domain-containing protein n=1 Tax=Sphingopyxis sp. RIFCSPHIGHO2_12_FULL_65_19 TaxID=1802172 RepID=UPI0008BC97C2|nr:cupin-like domain-containing protein [Sphingopyxis sp. RIFCSPHIGHO2_12_FULL_65_19]OHD10022.1 MAG: transcriptional regulator [Sphingopyxis sp. RIFCSPHIGHO2_12_FULL_65_19]
MTAHQPIARPVFPSETLDRMQALYPRNAGLLHHHLPDHPLLSLEALARLGESLPTSAVEYNPGNVPIGIRPEDIPSNGLSIGETIRTIDSNGSWAVLKNIENVEAYRTLLMDLLGELEPVVAPRTGAMLTPQGFIFISSPGSITPFHFDPEHNILLQLRGTKVMNVWPAGDERFADRREHERYHAGGHRNLPWQDIYQRDAQQVPLAPGDAVLMPVMAPHFVANGDAPSISLSITWRSEWSYRESEAHAANAALRRIGFDPAMPPRWPRYAWFRSAGWRVARKLKLVS